MKKLPPQFWTHFAISLTIVAGMLAGNLKSEPLIDYLATASGSTVQQVQNTEQAASFQVEVIGQGPAVLLIPGLMSNSEVWRPLAQQLAGQYQLHLISIAGFAGTKPITGPLLPKVKADLLQYIQQHKLTRPAIVGHSLGAFLAFDLACSAPDQIGNIIAVDGLPFLAPVFTRDSQSTVESVQAQAQYFKTMYQQMQPAQLKALTQQGIAIQATATAARQQVLQMAERSDPASVGQAVYELLSTDLRPQVHQIKTKVLLLGASGALTTPAERDAAKALYQQQISTIAQARLEFHTKSRHFMMLDQPAWLQQQIEQTLQE